jgi:hypothetical protein
LVAGGAAAGRMTATRELPVLPSGQTATGSGAPAATTSGEFRTADDALKALASAQQTYQTAAAFLAAQDTTAHFVGLNQNTYRTRLKALDDITASTRTALYQAPQDPVLNQYYLNTLAARNATLTLLRQATPATNQFRGYGW